MRKFTKFAAFCLLQILCFNLKAQEAGILKSFINENDIAVRSVQKYSINLTEPSNENNVMELLKLQIASVNFFTSDPQKSADIAYLIREKCADFLNKNSKGSIEYLKLTDKERLFFSSPKPVDQTKVYLNKRELQKIESLNIKDPQIFDNLTTRIK